MSRRIFKKLVTSCMECPALGPVYSNKESGVIVESWCREYERKLDHQYLDPHTRMMNFPTFCKLEEER